MNVATLASAAASYREPPLQDTIDAVMAGAGRTIETAENLPHATYTSQSFFDLEVERLFKRDWTCVGHVSQIPNVGDYFTLDLFNDLLIVVRGPDRIRVMSRVCLHRWASIVSGTGNAKAFACPFHNWTYDLKGELRAAPFMQQATDFPNESCRLPEMRTEIIEELGLIFITWSDTVEPIGARIPDLIERFRPYRLNEAVSVMPALQEVPYNWKISIETAQECYHHFAAHKQTLEPRLPTRLSWCEAGTDSWTACHSGLKPDLPQEAATIGLPNFKGVPEENLRRISYYHIFPLTRIFLRPDRVILRSTFPVNPTLTRTTRICLVAAEVAADAEMIAEKFRADSMRNKTQNGEDTAICEMQQQGAHSSFAKPGRLSQLEATVWHLGEYVRRGIAAA